jgi:hypothetical protein
LAAISPLVNLTELGLSSYRGPDLERLRHQLPNTRIYN